MAVPVAVYECRSTATAGNVNGGGFNSARGGTDYTLQDAAQVTASDGTSTASTTFVSATSTFTSAMVGNFLHLVSGAGATAGWYEIVTYTNATTVVLDRNSGTYTLGVFYVGGAMSLASTLDDEFFEIFIAGSTCYIKNGTYTMGEAVSTAKVGTSALPMNVIGYDTTRGDAPAGATRPTLAFGANVATLGTYWNFDNIIFTTTEAAGVTTGGSAGIYGCKSTNSSGTAGREAITTTNAANNDRTRLTRCEAVSTSGNGIAGITSVIIGNYVHDCGQSGIITIGSHCLIESSIVDTCVTAITISSGDNATIVVSNTLYSGTTGINMPGTTATNCLFLNNIISGFTTGASAAANVKSNFWDYNNFYNNTTDRSNVDAGANDVDTDPAFVDAPNGNFMVGSAMKIGMLGAFPGALTTSYSHMGAVQPDVAAGSGGGMRLAGHGGLAS